MKEKTKVLSLNFRFLSWKRLSLLAIACFYLVLFGTWVGNNGFPTEYGEDFLAFWSAGKIAEGKGYSEIYDLENLRSVQSQELKSLGFLGKTDDSSIPPLPAAILSFFVPPFQLLSKVDARSGFRIWTIFNLVILLGYLIFLLKELLVGRDYTITVIDLLILGLISFPVFSTIGLGQVNIFLLVCSGEFIRNAIGKKPILSGLWVGGFLLKPQLLILIIPILFIKHYWKALIGFLVTAGIILTTSFLLSGVAGMNALINLWTKYSAGIASSAPENMINWRMVGVNLNTLLNTSAGWTVTGLGMILTIIPVYFLIKRNPAYGSPEWVITMLGILCATLAITWHSHYHTALILIPFLIYVTVNKLLPEQLFYLWTVVTPLLWLGIGIVGALTLFWAKINILEYQGMIIAFSGFVINLAILFFTLKVTYQGSLLN